MRKFILASLVAIAFSANALEVTVATGRDMKLDKDLTTVSVGKSLGKFDTDVQFSRVQGQYQSYGANAGKAFRVGPVSVSPHVGLAYVDNVATASKDGYAASTGVSVDYALSKTVSLTADVSRTFDVKKSTDFVGNTVTFGIKGSF
jgi:hypothetical protein